MGKKILSPACCQKKLQCSDMEDIVAFFSFPDSDEDIIQKRVETINRIAPSAYVPNKKLSRVFKAICQAVDVADEAKGSHFQKLYAEFADELSAKKIDFKLFVSINPAHFLTMSNPKGDKRGNTLISCHSLNSTEYTYNSGCSGYACDDVSIIVFTVTDPDDPETLNNRKTTRQIFAYKPGNGILLQSRLYNTYGGTTGAQSTSNIYRDLIQRELAYLEAAPNLWKTGLAGRNYSAHVQTGEGFGGYTDWIYEGFEGKVSIRSDHADDCKPLVVGTYGNCISCGEKVTDGLFCNNCFVGYMCDDCESYCEETFEVYDSNGDMRHVCEYCRGEYYTYCSECESYHPDGQVTEAYNGDYICSHCLERYYTRCEKCDEYYPNYDIKKVKNSDSSMINICCDCQTHIQEAKEEVA